MLFLRARIPVTLAFALLFGACAYEDRYLCDDAPSLALGALDQDARETRDARDAGDARDALDPRELPDRDRAPSRVSRARSFAPRPALAATSPAADTFARGDDDPDDPDDPSRPDPPRPIPVDPSDPDDPHDPDDPDTDPNEPLPDEPAAALDAAGNPDDDTFVPTHLGNFSWVDTRVAGMAYPGEGPTLEAALDDLAAMGFDLFVSLTEVAPPASSIAAHGMTPVHLPVRDQTPPTTAQVETFFALVRDADAAGKKVVVHCFAGLGRTGTMLAARRVMDGEPAAQAIARIRALRPGSIETPSQEAFLFYLAATLATP